MGGGGVCPRGDRFLRLFAKPPPLRCRIAAAALLIVFAFLCHFLRRIVDCWRNNGALRLERDASIAPPPPLLPPPERRRSHDTSIFPSPLSLGRSLDAS